MTDPTASNAADAPLQGATEVPDPGSGWARPLRPLIATQFLGAFNDNAWKLFVPLFVVARLQREASAAEEAFELEPTLQGWVGLSMIALTIPLALFSLPAGMLADRFAKRALLVGSKIAELVLMVCATLALVAMPDTAWPLVTIIALMGAQSAFFSPAKYGILPEILPHSRLSEGNGYLELWTFLAIILGTAAAGLLLDLVGPYAWAVGVLLTLLAAAGVYTAWQIPRIAPLGAGEDVGASGWAAVAGAWQAIRSDRVLRLVLTGGVLYWGVATLLGQDLVVYAKSVTAGLEYASTLSSGLLAACGVGIGVGGVVAGRMSRRQVELGLIPLGAFGFAALTLAIGVIGPGILLSYLLVFLAGITAGLIVVPLNAVLQWRAPAARRGAVLAVANVFLFSGTMVGALAGWGMAAAGLSARAILVVAGLVIAGGTVWALRLLPGATLRFVMVVLTNTVYRLRIEGRERIPETGGVLLVPNHVSFVDGLLITAATDRPVRFLVYESYYHWWLLKPLMKAMGAIPISNAGGPRVILGALREAGRQLDAGEVVCIFPEGQLTRTGMLQPFSRGLERIVKGRDVPIVPIYLDRIWGSIFSWERGRYIWKLPRRLPYPVTVLLGEPVPTGTPVWRLRRIVAELGTKAWEYRHSDFRPLHHDVVRRARRRPWRTMFADWERRASRLAGVSAAAGLAYVLRPQWDGQRYIGVLLPASIGSGIANLAIALAGKTGVNLNFTTGADGLQSAVRRTEMKYVVTAREFLDKAKVALPEGVTPIWIEEVLPRLTRGTKLAAMWRVLFAPLSWLESWCGAERSATVDDVATVLFTSGSTGEPKGVELLHRNLAANIEAATQVMHVSADDRVMGILPPFHSFGTMLLWFATTRGMGTIFHPSPLDAAAIGALIERERATILLATPTFLQIYLRRCTPAQFGSLRMVLCGAERLTDRLREAYEDRFGLQPLEGYGTTECSPIVAASTLDRRGPGMFQPGSKRGSVGQPLPGVAARIVDPEGDDLTPLPPEEAGMLIVRGPNVMRGYLTDVERTAAVFRDGWYVTGDIAKIDEDGFVRITDRLSRFSKIGGEMVPHGKVEDALHRAYAEENEVTLDGQQLFAVTSVADEKKGEQLAVVYTVEPDEIGPVLERMKTFGLPNLFLPRASNFTHIEELPRLGTGKVDIKQVKELAAKGDG